MASLMNLTDDMTGLSYTELMLIWNSDVDGAGICVRIVLLIVHLSNCFFWFIWPSACFTYDKIVINQWFSIFFGPWTIFFQSIWWATLLFWHLMDTSSNLHIGQWTFYRRFMELSVDRWTTGPRWESLS